MNRFRIPMFVCCAVGAVVSQRMTSWAAVEPARESPPQPASASLSDGDWRSIREAHLSWRHSFRETEAGYAAENPGLGWGLAFKDGGFEVRPTGGDWMWGLGLVSWGFAGHETTVTASGGEAARVEGARLTCVRAAGLHEWYQNDARGLEHGFTVLQRPQQGAIEASLVLHMSVRGELLPAVQADGLGASFINERGEAAVQYTGLKVWDAKGTVLPARLAAENGGVRIEVSERGAEYPLTVDPIVQTAFLKAGNNGWTGDSFGGSVAVSGDTVVVGAVFEDGSGKGVNPASDDVAISAGAVYVFVRRNGVWTQQAYLKAPNADIGDLFGSSVGISGDILVVGAPQEDGTGTGINPPFNQLGYHVGAAYIFERTGNTWALQAYLKASIPPGQGDGFGGSVAVSGNTVAVASAFEGWDSGTGIGTVYLFTRGLNGWAMEGRLKAPGTLADIRFGAALALSGDTLVVGASRESSAGTGVNPPVSGSASDAGAAYVYFRSNSVWSLQAFLKAANAGAYDNFGNSVSISGDTLVVGAVYESGSGTGVNPSDDNAATVAGAAYVFVRSGTTWTSQAYLKASNTGPGDRFGISVAISGDTIVVGAAEEGGGGDGANPVSDEAAPSAGAAYIFRRSGGVWSPPVYLKAANSDNLDLFGVAVAISGDTIVAGATGENGSGRGVNPATNESTDNAGAAYTFTFADSAWSQQSYLKASNTEFGIGRGDQFGNAISVSGDVMVIGAYKEDGRGTGVNPVGDEWAPQAGAAHVFIRTNGVWKYDALLKASNTGSADNFGYAVAVSGNTIVIGAPYEAGGGAGANPLSDESTSGAGAAYVFVRQNDIWSQQAYLKAFNPGIGDNFGIAVAISGDTLVIGAHREGSSGTGVDPPADEGAVSSGAAYVFVRSGNTWTRGAFLKASNTGASDFFGYGVAISGDTIVVGAPGEDTAAPGVNPASNEGASFAGAAYVFARRDGVWSQQAWLKGSNAGADDRFGNAVALSGDTLIVGASGEATGNAGVNPVSDETAKYSGAAYVFVRQSGVWSQQAWLKASNPSGSDGFGTSVAVDGEIAVAGAYGEDSKGAGIDPASDADLSNSGAAYVFIRQGTNWSQKTWLKASNPGESDYFGLAVAVSGDMVAAGAVYEDSVGAGVNSVPTEYGDDSGAVYLYNGLMPAWMPFTAATAAAGLSDAQAAPLATPYRDGVANLLKYAFNMNLAKPDHRYLTAGTGTTGLPAVTAENGAFRIEFVRRTGSGLVYTPLASTDLTAGTWQPLTSSPVVTPVNAAWERVVYEGPAVNPGERMFLVVRVSFVP